MTIEEKAKTAAQDAVAVPGSIVVTGISELQLVLDLITSETDKLLALAPAVVDSAESTADASLENIKTHASSGLALLTEFLHLAKNPPVA